MIVPWLLFIAVGLIIYAGLLKLAACLLRYSVSWNSSFLFAGIMLVAVIVDHILVVSQPMAIRIGHGAVLLIGLVLLGSWFFSGRGRNRSGALLGWSGGLRLMALAFAMIIVVAFIIVVLVQIFLSKQLAPPP
jgi:hypothetical protein